VSAYVVQCGGASPLRAPKEAKKVQVRLYKPSPTASFQFWNVTHAILKNLSPTWLDLLEIAAYVYIADTECARWSERDVLNKRWRRQFHFSIPVQNRQLWNGSRVKGALIEALEHVTGDTFHFKFTARRPPSEQLFADLGDITAFGSKPNAVALLSGGADSLAGGLYLLEELGLTPVFVSHRSVPTLDTRQQGVLTLLKARYGESRLGHVSLWLHRRGRGARETTQRSRGFLFLALATTVAKQLRIDKVFVPENGPVSLNVRKLQQSYSTTLSQTTHPEFLASFERLANVLGGTAITISNPFVFETKSEVLARLRKYNADQMLQETVSCAHTQGRSVMRPHCGVCSQCIDRRFAAASAGLQNADPATRYEVDIFRHEIPEGEPRMQVEGHLRLAARLATLSPDAVLLEHPSLVDAAAALPVAAQSGPQLVAMLHRLAIEVRTVIGQQLSLASAELLAGTLPPHCAIRLAANAEHLRELPERMASAVTKALGQGLPVTFQTHSPGNEREVQDAAEAILASDKSPWLREGPLLPFTVVKTKPDFSTETPRFFIEIKYPKSRERLNHVVTEITSRITVYRKQGASVLFLTYDPHRVIADDARFVSDIRDGSKVFAEVVR
jgi:7-cyano-7-deazaguanine synthase in queuosine biosynthesis